MAFPFQKSISFRIQGKVLRTLGSWCPVLARQRSDPSVEGKWLQIALGFGPDEGWWQVAQFVGSC